MTQTERPLPHVISTGLMSFRPKGGISRHRGRRDYPLVLRGNPFCNLLVPGLNPGTHEQTGAQLAPGQTLPSATWQRAEYDVTLAKTGGESLKEDIDFREKSPSFPLS
jgi:hypothetical protein